MCHAIEARLDELREERRHLAAAMPQRIKVVLNDDGTQGGQDPENRLAILDAQIAVQEEVLADCLAQQQPNPVPRPLSATLTALAFDIGKRELGKEEPYLIVATVDMLAALGLLPPPLAPTPKPAVNTFLYGPYLNFRKETSRPLDEEPFWELDGEPRTIAGPQDVVFLVALVENDGSSPDAIRGAVNSALELSIVQNLGLEYDNFVTNLASAMAGAIDATGIAGLDPLHLNADDRIGRVQHLELTQDDLDHIYGLAPLQRTLVFERRKDNDDVIDRWRATFRFEA